MPWHAGERRPWRRQSGDVFASYWGAGFESACHVNAHGTRLDMIAATQHDRSVDADYGGLRELGLLTVRETARWHLVESSEGHFDFSTLEPMVAAASKHRLQVAWTLCHYGWPDGLDLLSPEFVTRFANYCRAVASFLARAAPANARVLTPINEISFLSWAAGETGWFFPYLTASGAIVKRQLVRACLAGIAAIREVDPRARILIAEPLIHVVPDSDTYADWKSAAAADESQFEVADMLLGRREPALGGNRSIVDIVGVNFYHDNQWEFATGRKLGWHLTPRDPRWRPLHLLLSDVFARYRRPLYVSETSHVGAGRAAWLHEIHQELILARQFGMPVLGACLYPIVDRCGWDDPDHWHNSGLWDLVPDADGRLKRVLNHEYALALRSVQSSTPLPLAGDRSGDVWRGEDT